MTAQTPRSKLHSAIARASRSLSRFTFLLRTALPCVWELFLFRPLGGNRLVSKPDGETAPLAQGGVVLRPIHDPALLLRKAVTASGMGFEWHGRNL